MFFSRGGVPPDATNQPSTPLGLGVVAASALAFYAYIGFEDIINVAEEVRQPERAFPKAIIVTVLVCGAIHAVVSIVALSVIPVATLTQADAPLVAVVQRAAPSVPSPLFTVIALLAVANRGC